MKSTLKFLLVLIVAAGVGAIGYYYGRTSVTEEQKPTEAVTPSATTTTLSQEAMSNQGEDQEDKEDGAETSNAQPLVIPEGKTFADVLSDFFGKEIFTTFFHADDLETRFVTSVDNAVGEVQPSWKVSPLNGPESDFIVSKSGTQWVIDPANYKRYDPYVDLLRKTDMKQMTDIYIHFYSAFQSAYAELGSDGTFNDRVLAVISILLKTPDLKKPIVVFRASPHGRYLYKNDELENLTPAQKILLRMGPENEQLVKQKLHQIRRYLVRFVKEKK